MALGNIGGLIKRITTRRKNSQTPDKSDSSSRRLTSKGKSAIVLGIVIAVIGFAGAIYYGSQFVKEEVSAGGTLPYTLPSHIKNVSHIDLEIVFVVIGVIGFGIFTYGFATKVDKPLDFYPS
jgi:nitric oxide reductase large subunit